MFSGGDTMSRFGATIFGCSGLRLTSAEKAFFKSADPFGFILFARNIDSAAQVRALCAELRDCVGREAMITIDQEGGRVQRLRPPLASQWEPPLEHIGAAGAEAAARAMYLRYAIIAAELRALGIDSNCAPMVDVAEEGTHPFLKNRCYGFDAQSISRIGAAVAQAHLDGGVLPIVKHIPGHGRARADSHLELPTVSASAEDLMRVDFAPFKALNHLPLGMTAHLVYSAMDPIPATLSPRMMEVIRKDIGFGGLIMTDDISMKALSGPLGGLSRSALAAGCDVILHCNGEMDEMREVAEAAGHMSTAAQARADAALLMRKTPDPVDISALNAQLEALIGGRLHG